MKSRHKLRVKYMQRYRDVVFAYPLGTGVVSDAHWLSTVITKEFTEELERRGYDPKTLRFSVEPQRGNEKFASQRKGDSERA